MRHNAANGRALGAFRGMLSELTTDYPSGHDDDADDDGYVRIIIAGI